jgi:hypothetical protein
LAEPHPAPGLTNDAPSSIRMIKLGPVLPQASTAPRERNSTKTDETP